MMRQLVEGHGVVRPRVLARLPGDARELPDAYPGLLIARRRTVAHPLFISSAEERKGAREEIYEGLAWVPGDSQGGVNENEAIIFPAPPAPSKP